MAILINLPPVNNFVGTMVMPCCLAAARWLICLRLANSFRAEVSTVRAFGLPLSFCRKEKLALLSHNSPFRKVT